MKSHYKLSLFKLYHNSPNLSDYIEDPWFDRISLDIKDGHELPVIDYISDCLRSEPLGIGG